MGQHYTYLFPHNKEMVAIIVLPCEAAAIL